jgi:predicted ATPase with chaperone activity
MLQSELRCQIRSSSGHGLDITASENGLVGGSSPLGPTTQSSAKRGFLLFAEYPRFSAGA